MISNFEGDVHMRQPSIRYQSSAARKSDNKPTIPGKGAFILLCRIFSVDRPTKFEFKVVTLAVWLPLEAYKPSNSNFLGRTTENYSVKQNKSTFKCEKYFGSPSEPWDPLGKAKLSYWYYVIRWDKAERCFITSPVSVPSSCVLANLGCNREVGTS